MHFQELFQKLSVIFQCLRLTCNWTWKSVLSFMQFSYSTCNINLIRRSVIGFIWIRVVPWYSGYHYCTTSFIKAWTQVLRRFKSFLRRVGDSRWWGSLTVGPAGNKATPFVGQPYHKKNSSSSSSSSSSSLSSVVP